MSRNPKAWHLVDKGSPNDPEYSVINISLDYIHAHTYSMESYQILDDNPSVAENILSNNRKVVILNIKWLLIIMQEVALPRTKTFWNTTTPITDDRGAR